MLGALLYAGRGVAVGQPVSQRVLLVLNVADDAELLLDFVLAVGQALLVLFEPLDGQLGF